MVRVRHQVATRAGLGTQTLEDGPVPGTWGDQDGVGAITKSSGEPGATGRPAAVRDLSAA